MPVIRENRPVPKIDAERRASLLGRLVGELNGAAEDGGPVIYEIPLGRADMIDVMVLWDDWDGVPGHDRTQIIQQAYENTAPTLSLALGVTTGEALSQGLLPYRVKPLSGDTTTIPTDQLATAFHHAGMRIVNGEVQALYPTEALAVHAADQLERELPGTRWAVRQVS